MTTVGITFGCFDLFHPGHILLLGEAKENCDYLIVCVQADPSLERPEKNTPVQTYFERVLQVETCEYVDHVVPYSHESDIIKILATFMPDIRFLGDDYVGKDFTGKAYCEENGIEIHYVDRSHGLSTSELRQRIKESK